jgi:hypothetical protein
MNFQSGSQQPFALVFDFSNLLVDNLNWNSCICENKSSKVISKRNILIILWILWFVDVFCYAYFLKPSAWLNDNDTSHNPFQGTFILETVQYACSGFQTRPASLKYSAFALQKKWNQLYMFILDSSISSELFFFEVQKRPYQIYCRKKL